MKFLDKLDFCPDCSIRITCQDLYFVLCFRENDEEVGLGDVDKRVSYYNLFMIEIFKI